MDDFGITPFMPSQRDAFGSAYEKMMQVAPPTPQLPRPSPMEETPRIQTRDFLGSPRMPYRRIVAPPMAMAPASNVLPFSPVRGPRQENTGNALSVEDITKLVRRAESSGNYTALNRERKGNTASGAYQYTDATWNNYGGYPKAMLAPPEVQDQRFAEDIAKRYARHNGDPFRIIADHYLPAFADNPEVWNQTLEIPVRGGKKVKVKPIANYIRHVVKGTPLEAELDDYLARYAR